MITTKKIFSAIVFILGLSIIFGGIKSCMPNSPKSVLLPQHTAVVKYQDNVWDVYKSVKDRNAFKLAALEKSNIFFLVTSPVSAKMYDTKDGFIKQVDIVDGEHAGETGYIHTQLIAPVEKSK